MFVLIPAYEPDQRLLDLVVELRSRAPRLEILVVDDGSGVAYASIFDAVRAAGARVMTFAQNRGKGAALKAGFAWISREGAGASVVTADADGQHTVADIERIANALIAGAANRDSGNTVPSMVLGCRDFAGEVPFRSRFGNAVSRGLFRAVAGWRLRDTQTGLRGIPSQMLDWLATVPGERFEYEQSVLLRLRGAGYGAVQLPITTVYLEENRSSHFRPILDSVRVMLPVALFAASSLTAFAIDAITLFLLQALTGALIPSIIGARVLSAGANFVVNRRLVFARRGRAGLLREALQYLALAALLLASNIVWMSFLTEHGVPLWLAKVVTEGVLFLTSYRVQRGVIFTARGNTEDAADPEPTTIAKTPFRAV